MRASRMKVKHQLVLSLAFAHLLLPAAALADDAPKAVTVTPVFSGSATVTGQPITLPAGPASVIVSRYVIQPGAKLPVHRHPYHRYAYVEAGTLAVYAADSGKRFDYKAGDFIVELLGDWHYGENTGSAPVELLVIDQVPEGVTGNTEVRP
ncbi:cupin domain-containing protein [Zavarzinia sp.]|uniref:cupin domain-containing protein n=1 Tax=Zavarzinia sp. TaxID=2027920 RepID=UPI003561E300